MDNNWSIEAIQNRAANNWSLEGDNQLLNLMKSISKNLEQRCITSNNNLNRLMLDVDKTKVKLGNATTKLLDLNNTIFVEHTVMDIDSSLSNTEKCFTVENDKNFVPLPKAIEEAVTNGLNMMDRCYEKVLLELDDSDEDENDNGQKHVVCRRRNPYLNRHLPHLIGSKKWTDKWHIGLIESDEEVLSDEEVEEFSQSEDGDSISISPQTSNPPTASESDFAPPTPTVIPQNDLFRRLSDDVEENSPLFTPDYHANRERIKVLPTIVPSTTKDEPKIETTRKSKTIAEPSVPSLEQPQQSIFVQQKTEKKFLNLFDDEPPLLEEPIRSERKAPNLFLESDEEDDHIINPTKKPTSIFNNNVSKKPSLPFSIPQVDNVPIDSSRSTNAFLDDVDNNNVVPRSGAKPKSNTFDALFDDEPPDDFFDIIVRDKGAKVDNKKSENAKLQSKTVNLFESDDDDDDFSKIIGTSSKSGTSELSVAARSNTNETISATKNIERADIRRQETYSEYSSPFKTLQNTGPPKSYKSFLDDDTPSFDEESKSKPATSLLTSEKGLFDDEPVQSIPSLISNKGLFDEEPIVTPTLPTSTSKKGLFDDESPASIPPSTSKKGLFDDEPIVVIPPPTSKKVLLEDKPKISLPPSKNLFFDEEPPPDDIVVPAVVSTRKSQSKIFYNDIDESLSSKSILSDESSEDVLTKNIEKKSDENRTLDETDQSLSFKKNLNMFSNPETAKLPTIDKEKPKPNKLKTNFNINVAALLPGAKLPSQKQLVTAKQERIEEPVSESVGRGNEIFGEKNENIKRDTVSSGNIAKVTSSHVDDNSGLLTSLSKTRAKIPVQRKPSTRTGRQRLYVKSLLEENENAESSETTDSGNLKPGKIREQIADITPSDKDSEKNDIVAPAENITEGIADVVVSENIPEQNSDVAPSENISKKDVEDDWLSKATMFEEPPPLQANIDEDEEDWLKNVDEKPSSPSKTNLYDENDWLSTKETSTERKATNQNLSHVMNYDWLTASSLPPEDINPPPLSVDDYHEQDDWLTSYATKEKPPPLDDLPNDEDDWLTSSKAQEQPRKAFSLVTETKTDDDWLVNAVSKSETNRDVKVNDDWLTSTKTQEQPREVSSSFAETKVEDDWLVNAVSKSETNNDVKEADDWLTSTKTQEQPRGAISKVTQSKAEDDWLVTAVSKSETNKGTKLEDEEDDWFAKSLSPPIASSKKTSKLPVSEVLKPSPPKLGFVGESSKISESKAPTKKPLNSSLFDDDEDDDDLFTPISKQKPVAKQTTSKTTVSKAVKSTKNVSINRENKIITAKTSATEKSLFSDDESDPDDLFGSSKSRKTQQDNKEKRPGEKVKANSSSDKKSMKGGLFDDEDDDDEDIFSSKTVKHRVNKSEKIKKPSITKLVATIPASNDPLADLLK